MSYFCPTVKLGWQRPNTYTCVCVLVCVSVCVCWCVNLIYAPVASFNFCCHLLNAFPGSSAFFPGILIIRRVDTNVGNEDAVKRSDWMNGKEWNGIEYGNAAQFICQAFKCKTRSRKVGEKWGKKGKIVQIPWRNVWKFSCAFFPFFFSSFFLPSLRELNDSSRAAPTPRLGPRLQNYA